MSSDGSQLEELVAHVERTLLPPGFSVATRKHVVDDEGKQIAELDIEISGKAGSVSLRWLIECRDRPSSGAEPVSWIEQLVGRKQRFNFSNVTAVSTTGFTRPAVEYAQREGIQLREVKALIGEEFAWLTIQHIRCMVRGGELRKTIILLCPDETKDRLAAVTDALARFAGSSVLKSIRDGRLIPNTHAFQNAVEQDGTLFNDLLVDGQVKTVRLLVHYVDDADHFVVETSLGDIRVHKIFFEGELRLNEAQLPITAQMEYRNLDSGEAISQMVAFAPFPIAGIKSTLEMHRMAETGEINIVHRNAPDST